MRLGVCVLNDATTPAAPAPPAPVTISATRDAANKGDFTAFDDAHTASRTGAPMARVEAPPEPLKAEPAKVDPAKVDAAPVSDVSKRQQKINDYERRIAEQDQRIRALEAREAPAASRSEHPPVASAPPEAKVAEWKRLAAMPEAPKLADFESVEEHTAAMSLFIADTRHAERLAADRQQQDTADVTAAHQVRVDAFVARLEAAKTADPEFATKLSQTVKHDLKPFTALGKDEVGGPINVVGEQVYDSPLVATFLTHFSEHPEALDRLIAVPASVLALPASARANAHIQWIVREFGKLEAALEATPPAVVPEVEAAAVPSTITAAPPPPKTITRAGSTADPQAAALTRGDFKTWDSIEMSKKLVPRSA